jgi:hypothetical protein
MPEAGNISSPKTAMAFGGELPPMTTLSPAK